MIVAEQFLKSIPKYIKQEVFNRLTRFEQLFLENEKQIRELPAGYWVKRIKNTDIFKFRLNNKDRILFSFISKRNQNRQSEIIFIKYATHDEQIRIGKKIDIERLNPIELEINKMSYQDDIDEQELETEVTNWIEDGKLDLNKIAAVVVKDEWLPLLSDESNEDLLYYLSDEQYEVLENLNQPVVLSGAGGTGKTVVLVNVLSLAKAENKHALYLSYSELLVERTENMYHKYIGEKQEQCTFYTMKQLLKQVLGDEIDELVTTQRVMTWLDKNIRKYRTLKKKDTYEILGEINGIIKGYLGLEYREIRNVKFKNATKLSLEQYLNIPRQYSALSEEEKRDAYKLTEEYEKWLIQEKLVDTNDLSRKVIMQCNKKWDWIIVDEVQDLSEVQIYMISQLLKSGGYIIWAGDMNQTINSTFFHFGRIKNLYYTYGIPIKSYTLKKNYRSTSGNIEFINQMTAIRKKVIGASKYDYEEIGIKKGERPILLDTNSRMLKEIIENVKDKHYCAILVPNQRVKEQLVQCYKEAEKRIFMLHEIKGLEYENIFCYNIMSTYVNVWKEILEGRHKNQEHMKYYFNLLYVAASRAKNKLIFYEEEVLPFEAFSKCDNLNYYDEMRLGLSTISSKEDWKKEVLRLEKVGQEEQAKLARDYAYEELIDEVNKGADESFSKIYANVSQEVEENTEVEQLLKPGVIAYRQRNYTKAKEIFDQVREKFPDESKVYYYLANTYGYMTGGMEYSIRFFEKAIELDPYQYEYYIDMACILRVLRRYEEAIRILDQSSKVFPNLANAYEVKSTIYNETGHYEKAMNMYKKAKKYPRYVFHEETKSWSKPSSLSKVVSVNKGENVEEKTTILKIKGLEYLQIEKEYYIKQCIEGVPLKRYEYKSNKKMAYIQFDLQKCNVCKNRNECIFSQSNKKGSLRILETELKSITSIVVESKKKIKEKTPQQKDLEISNTKKLLEVSKYYNQGKFKEAATKYKEVIDMIEKEDDTSENIMDIKSAACEGLGNCYINLNDLEQAEKYLKEVNERNDNRFYESCNSLGVIYLRKQKFEQAIGLFKKVVGYKPSYTQARENLKQARYFISLQQDYSNHLNKIVGDKDKDKQAQQALVEMFMHIDMLTPSDSSSHVLYMYMQLGKGAYSGLIDMSKELEERMGEFLGVPYMHVFQKKKNIPFMMREFARRMFYCVVYMEGLYTFLNRVEHKKALDSIKCSKEVAQAVFRMAYFASVQREKRCEELL